MREVRKANWFVAAVLILIVGACAGLQLGPTAASGQCDKIAYYESYMKGALPWVQAAQMVPGVAGLAAKAFVILSNADKMAQDAQAQCVMYSQGQTTVDKIQALITSLGIAVNDFNKAYTDVQSALKQ